MKKVKANIQIINEGTKQVTGYYTEVKLETGELAEVLIHRDYNYPDYWNVSEYATGVSITPNISDSTVTDTRNGVLSATVEYVNRKLKEKKMTLHELKQDFLKSTGLHFVN
jgi:hypothetical protein